MPYGKHKNIGVVEFENYIEAPYEEATEEEFQAQAEVLKEFDSTPTFIKQDFKSDEEAQAAYRALNDRKSALDALIDAQLKGS